MRIIVSLCNFVFFKCQFICLLRLITFPQDIRKAIELWGNDLPNVDIIEFEDESLKKHLQIMLGKNPNKKFTIFGDK